MSLVFSYVNFMVSGFVLAAFNVFFLHVMLVFQHELLTFGTLFLPLHLRVIDVVAFWESRRQITGYNTLTVQALSR